MIIATADRPSLFDLWTTHRFQPRIISLLAGVEEQTIHAMMMYLPVSRDDAQKVLIPTCIQSSQSQTAPCRSGGLAPIGANGRRHVWWQATERAVWVVTG